MDFVVFSGLDGQLRLLPNHSCDDRCVWRGFGPEDAMNPSPEDPDWIERAFSYEFEHASHFFKIERRSRREPVTWVAVSDWGVLDHVSLDFVYEPMPSSRTEEFVHATRFPTKEAAYDALRRFWAAHDFVGSGYKPRLSL